MGDAELLATMSSILQPSKSVAAEQHFSELIAREEGPTFARMASIPPMREALAVLIASLANSGGGIILFGVDSSRNVIGVDPVKLGAMMGASLSLMEPIPSPMELRLGYIRDKIVAEMEIGHPRESVLVEGMHFHRKGADTVSQMSLSGTGDSIIQLARMVERRSKGEPLKAFISYKWGSKEHNDWVQRFALDLRKNGIDAVLDQNEIRYGESFTDYMQRNIAGADVILFVITPESVAAAEAPSGKGGALKFEVQMMNARRMSEGVRIIGIYRSGDRPPHYLRDHKYADFRRDADYANSVQRLVEDLLGSAPHPLR